jgi:hypothetical protein
MANPEQTGRKEGIKKWVIWGGVVAGILGLIALMV